MSPYFLMCLWESMMAFALTLLYADGLITESIMLVISWLR
jgi:hypothetical protein